MFTIRYMKCGRKWRVVAHEGVVNEGFYCMYMCVCVCVCVCARVCACVSHSVSECVCVQCMHVDK